MTCLVWDGKYLCADKATTDPGHKVQKVFRINDKVVCGLFGEIANAMKVVRWLQTNYTKKHHLQKDYPEFTSEDNFGVIVIDGSDNDRSKPLIREYTRFGKDPIDYIDTKTMAWGSGSPFALGWMYAMEFMNVPFSGVSAVAVASTFDIFTGNESIAIGLYSSQ